MPAKVENLIGRTFGSLTVIAGPFKSPRNKERTRFEAAWKCQCVCGNYWFASSGHLRQGNVTSCGCVRAKMALTKRKRRLIHAQ